MVSTAISVFMPHILVVHMSSGSWISGFHLTFRVQSHQQQNSKIYSVKKVMDQELVGP